MKAIIVVKSYTLIFACVGRCEQVKSCAVGRSVACCLLSTYLWIFQLSSVINFQFYTIVVRKDAWYDFSPFKFIKTCFVVQHMICSRKMVEFQFIEESMHPMSRPCPKYMNLCLSTPNHPLPCPSSSKTCKHLHNFRNWVRTFFWNSLKLSYFDFHWFCH